MAPLPAGTNELTEPRVCGNLSCVDTEIRQNQNTISTSADGADNGELAEQSEEAKSEENEDYEEYEDEANYTKHEEDDDCTTGTQLPGGRGGSAKRVHLLDRAACDIIRKDRDEWLRAAAVDNKAIRHGVFGTEACQLLADVCEKAERATVVKKEESAATWLEEKGEFSSNCYDL
ncbi:hypothetical protein M7I_0143 [Glarea lozoyensis 74030]|uniref:Uncharacterized protein n=1 Tax=Glarea lozoyensis (strain ATCC 74030 / MF5533) TaxID=1104152 RepID=H0ECK1_GLAL7|nr:hypothetical protein M7I_0143 [Glarea lozoyensis 74030]